MILTLALRNLTRNVRRTALSMTAIVAGVAVLIMGQGLIGGLEENIIHAQVDTLSAHVTVRPVDWPSTPMQLPLEGWFEPGPVEAALRPHGATTARVEFNPTVVHGPDALRVRAFGLDVVADEAVFPRTQWHVDGHLPAPDERAVVLGEGVARILSVNAGDRVILKSRTPDGAINALDVEVAGRIRIGNPAVDRFGMLVPIGLARELQNTTHVTQVHLLLPSRAGAEAVAATIRASLAKDPGLASALQVVTWEEETHDLIESQQIRRSALTLLEITLLGMAATSIANTVLMAAYERIREIGTLRALGMTRRDVVGLFVTEGALMGLVGGSLGTLIGALINLRGATVGFDLSKQIEGAKMNIPISTMLYTEWSWPMLAISLAFGVAVATLASIYPAWVASKLEPADAIRAD